MAFYRKYKKIEPASGAIIMANGIFMIGAVSAFPLLNIQIGKFLAFLLLITWIVIYYRLSVQFFDKKFLIPFMKHPVNSFAIGTWIAGVSVICNVFLKYFPKILPITQAMGILNTFLWIFYLFACFYNFKKLLIDRRDYPVHGVILLSTVGTQSIMVLLNNVFFMLPVAFCKSVIYLGIIFYVLGIVLIFKRYVLQKGWNLVDDWANTNCIIHGALSITGLAIVTTNSFPPTFVSAFWMFVFVLLIVIEVLEIVRAVKRVQVYGWNKGIFTYHVSQWSRNFTFGMFYTFSLVMQNNAFFTMSNGVANFHTIFMSIWAWVVLLALLGEIAVYVKSRFLDRELTRGRQI